MSGTSLDGVDGVLANLDDGMQVLAHRHSPMPQALRAEMLALNRPGDNELHRAALAGNALAALYAANVSALLQAAGLGADAVSAIGAHGQTVRHRPGAFDDTGYTLQLLNGALLAELSGIDVVCDVRSADVAAGGQGAPLVPAFHARCFARAGVDLAVLNLGGIANLSLLPAAGSACGFDCGPGNILLDLWCQRHRGHAYDDDGLWAASGAVNPALLQALRADPYFALAPPKSTGRDLFDAPWMDGALSRVVPVSAVDVQATLAALTVGCVADALRAHAPFTQELLVCGGGAHNGHLMHSLASALPALNVHSTRQAGVPPDQVEALAFAWLAAERVARRPGNLPAVTGARGPRILGALHAAR